MKCRHCLRRSADWYIPISSLFDDLDTYSRGREPDRRLMVRLAQPDAVEPSEFA